MNEPMDRVLVDWLREGPDTGPLPALDRALAASRRTSQRPGWSFPERWLPMQLTMQRVPTMRPLLFLALVALLVLAIATALVAGSQRRLPSPFGPAGNGAIVFEQNGDLFIADALSGTSRSFVAGPETDSDPKFSNQGDRVAFVRPQDGGGFELLSIRPDGSDVRSLASLPGDLNGYRWSPDGSAILLSYTETDPSGLRLAVVNADGSGSRHLDVGVAADWASWRPGGRHLAFRGQIPNGTVGAFIADADGTNVRRLPIDATGDLDFEGLNWSPDGTRLGFMSGSREAGWQIGVADIAPTGELTASRALKFDPESFDEMLPAWSPDSSQFAFILMKDNIYQMAIGRPDGTGLRMVGPRIVDRNGFGYGWAPDGRSLLIAARMGSTSLWSVDPTTGEATAVDAPTDRIPAWQRVAS